jgi:hypothetical protein
VTVLIQSGSSRAALSFWSASVSLIALFAVRGARAEEPEAEPAVSYDAPAECPTKKDFVGKVRARTRARSLASRGPGTIARLDVTLAPSKAGKTGTVATLVVTDIEGRKSTRRLAAPSCREAAEGLSLITALTLDPYAPDAAKSTPPAGKAGESSDPGEAGEGKRGEPGGSGDSGASTPGSPGAEPAEGEKPGDANDAAAGAASESTTTKSTKPGDESITLEESARAKNPTGDQFPKLPLVPAKPPPPVVREGALPSHFSASFAALEIWGPLPNAVPGLELGGEGRLEMTSILDVGIRIGLRLAAGTALDTNQGDATFEWWAFGAGICPGLHSTTDALSIAACALVEQGQTHAAGNDTENPRSSRRNWTAFGPGLHARWAVVPRMALEVGAEAMIPAVRDTFSIGTLTVHEVPAVAFRLGAGVAFRFQ